MSWRLLENVLKTSWRRMTKTNILVLIKTSWRRLEDFFWRRRVRQIYSSWSTRLEKTKTKDVFKTSLSRRMFAGWHYTFWMGFIYLGFKIMSNSTKTCFSKNSVASACLNMRKYIMPLATIVCNNSQKLYRLLDGGNFYFL